MKKKLATQKTEALYSGLTEETVTDVMDAPLQPNYTKPGVSSATSRGRAALQTMRFNTENDAESVSSFDIVSSER